MEQEKNKSTPSHKKVILAGRVTKQDDGLHIALTSPALYRHFLQTYTKPGDHVSMELTAKKPKRSESQNNFYHLYLSLVALSSGHSMLELKSWVCLSILGKGVSEVYGDTVRVVGSSSDLNMSEFMELMNTLEERTDIPIPDPAPFNLPLTLDEYGRLKEIQADEYAAKTPSAEFVKEVTL